MNSDALNLPVFFPNEDFDTHFKVFHELMSNKVFEILLVASPYDAYILEEDGSLASKIINEYRGLNLSRPPRITQAATAAQAMDMLARKPFHLVIAMPHLDDMDVFDLGLQVKRAHADLPVVLLAHSVKGIYPAPEGKDTSGIDQTFIWSGDSDLLLAIVKSMEDRLNVAADTRKAMVRVLILVEDSPLYTSYFLPLIYKEVVNQTQEVLEESLNQEHRLLKMRARPKILVAESYEQAMSLYRRYGD
ncbi:MAG: phosphoenolpyruvate synthase/pyruvate phosphate dikinase, partial [Desulfobacteraceae bacterium]|nr:phosphoenolpyruvate synthase/pyruvate phosphate dikinase [Desulfobacteraceae bacterium]